MLSIYCIIQPYAALTTDAKEVPMTKPGLKHSIAYILSLAVLALGIT